MTADLLDYLGVASLVGEGRGLCGWGPWEQASSSEDAANVKKQIMESIRSTLLNPLVEYGSIWSVYTQLY